MSPTFMAAQNVPRILCRGEQQLIIMDDLN